MVFAHVVDLVDRGGSDLGPPSTSGLGLDSGLGVDLVVPVVVLGVNPVALVHSALVGALSEATLDVAEQSIFTARVDVAEVAIGVLGLGSARSGCGTPSVDDAAVSP
jgi:hypothetical protein